jgi:hypothetical protein
MSKYICFTKLKYLIFINGESIAKPLRIGGTHASTSSLYKMNVGGRRWPELGQGGGAGGAGGRAAADVPQVRRPIMTSCRPHMPHLLENILRGLGARQPRRFPRPNRLLRPETSLISRTHYSLVSCEIRSGVDLHNLLIVPLGNSRTRNGTTVDIVSRPVNYNAVFRHSVDCFDIASLYIYIVHYLKRSFLDTLLFLLPRHEVSKYKAIEGGPWTFKKYLIVMEYFKPSKTIDDYEFK